MPAAAGAAFAVVARGTCLFDVKLARIEAKGYAAALVVNTEGAQGCGLFRMGVRGGIPAFAVERSVGFSLFDIPGYDEARLPGRRAREPPARSPSARRATA